MTDLHAVARPVPTGTVEGVAAEPYLPVVDAFVANFHQHDEVGASLCISVGGEVVVDVWGGTADASTGRPWQRDTISVVHSCTKAMVALCAHVLASRGLLDVEAPVAEVWPELARAGKERATVRMLLDHTVGVPVLRGPLAPGELLDWDAMVARLEAEEPFWEPGTRQGYHLMNFGWLVGEVVRRVAGRPLGAAFRDLVAGPLGLDAWIGLPAEHEPRVAPLLAHQRRKGDPLSAFQLAIVTDPTSIPALSVANLAALRMNSREAHAAELGGGGGITNARGLAGMYTPLALGGGGLVDAATLERMRRISAATNDDATLRIATRFAPGFMVSMDNRAKAERDSVVLGEHAFGHVGAGGSLGFADPSCGLAFGYTMNRMGPGVLLNERGQALVDAAYALVGA